MNFTFVFFEEEEATVEHYKILDFADFVTLVSWHKGSVNDIIDTLSEGSFSQPLPNKTSVIEDCNLKSKNLRELIASEISKPEYAPIDYYFIYGLMRAPRKHSEPEGSKILPVSVKITTVRDGLSVSLAYHKEIFIDPSRSRTPRGFFQEIGGEEVLETESELIWVASYSPFSSLEEIKKYLKKKSKLRENLFIVPDKKHHDLFGFADIL